MQFSMSLRTAAPGHRALPGVRLAALLIALLLPAISAMADGETFLERAFRNPPDSARPHTWWHFMNGNITKEGITLDLEAMKRVGVGGAQMFDVSVGIPPGSADYMSDEWRGLIDHAIREADRLGLELCIHNGAGWSSSGGPWITPPLAMQKLVTSEIRTKGATRLDVVLPQPETRNGYYRDIAVLAFPTPPAEAEPLPKPTVTTGIAGLDPGDLVDGDPNTFILVPSSGAPEKRQVTFDYGRLLTVRAAVVAPGAGQGGLSLALSVSDDGKSFTPVGALAAQDRSIARVTTTIALEPTTGRYFRIAPEPGRRVTVGEVTLLPGSRIHDVEPKAGYARTGFAPTTVSVPDDAIVPSRSVVDLTKQLQRDGRLTWDVPEGQWTIIRFGHTPTGAVNAPAPEPGRGLECDKLSALAVEVHFNGMCARIVEDVGPLAGRSFKQILIDSYEVDCQNWTPLFLSDFREGRGYDLLPYLPVMTGYVVDGVDTSERVLWDIRRTIADLFDDNYYGHYAELAHAHGMELCAEPYGNGNFDEMIAGGRADIPMGEFWVGGGDTNATAKLAASVAHTYGRKQVGAESFTSGPPQGRWQDHPFSLKAQGDAMYCEGINRFIFHRYAHQPWTDLSPGMTMGPFGFHFERTETWWEQSAAWLAYLARCQYLLQEGTFVADVCYLTSEDAPGSGVHVPGAHPGYDYDSLTPEVLLAGMTVAAGRLTLPSGAAYRVLVLPDSPTMSRPLLLRIRDLVRAGAVIVGSPPSRAPGLSYGPDGDRQVARIAADLWRGCDGKTVTERSYGKGRVFRGVPVAQVLDRLRIKPDFQVTPGGPDARVHSIHRRIGGADLYFVATASQRPVVVECIFRVAGRRPELWDPASGEVAPAPVFREDGGRTRVLIPFDPAGSVFVVFRDSDLPSDPVVRVNHDGRPVSQSRQGPREKLLVRRAIYGLLDDSIPDCVDVTTQLAALVREGRLTVGATNSLAGDPVNNVVKSLRVDYTYGGEPFTATVVENATLALPGEDAIRKVGAGGDLAIVRALYGLPPEGPLDALKVRVVDVTDRVAALVKDDTLSVEASNELAGQDPAPLIVKQMRIAYTLGGREYMKVVAEGQTVALPDGTEGGGTGAPFPAAMVAASDHGVVLTAFEAGEYEARRASGARLTERVATVPPPIEIVGAWDLRFPPGRGAPGRASMPKLASWTESDLPGVRYFSGTATYTKTFDVPADWLTEGRRAFLDLGVVWEIAEVRLNGRDLGILWKPPFRVDITDVARAGRNDLEVRVTNLWVNRLIGDEQLLADAEYSSDGPISAWPAWLVEGQPRPYTGRVAFTTWKHYKADAPLLPSGLLGPVSVHCGIAVALGEE